MAYTGKKNCNSFNQILSDDSSPVLLFCLSSRNKLMNHTMIDLKFLLQGDMVYYES